MNQVQVTEQRPLSYRIFHPLGLHFLLRSLPRDGHPPQRRRERTLASPSGLLGVWWS